jgi:tetratricopeptide (TPR) repeat protein
MAEAHHAKLSRRALREPDEFQAFTGQAFAWIQANQSAVVGGLSAIGAVLALVIGMGWYSSHQADTAAARLDAAQSLYRARKFADAATEFQAVAAAYPRTPAGHIAALYRAHALLQQPDAQGAVTAYTEYLAGSPPTDYLRQEALTDLGRAQEAAGNASAALDAYRQAADIAGPFAAQAKLAQARLQEAAGNTTAATAIYTELAKSGDLDPDTRQRIAGRLPAGAVPAAEATPAPEPCADAE